LADADACPVKTTMDGEGCLELLATDGMLVKRPLLIGEGVVLVGFREAEWGKAVEDK
jgi:arsenate reductase